jgi:hypothetical protein
MADNGASAAGSAPAPDEEPLHLTREEAASAIGVSLPTMDRLIRAGGDRFVVEVGSNGRPYKIDAAKLKAYRQERVEEDAAAELRHKERLRQVEMDLLGGEALGESGLSAEQRKKVWDEQLTLNKLRRERGELVELSRAERAYERRIMYVNQFMIGLPDTLARLLNWDPATTKVCVEQMETIRRTLALELSERNFLDD